MAIKKVVHADGSWTETADTPEDTKKLREKHDPGLQKRGEDAFHNAWLKQNKVGFEKVRGPDGRVTHVLASEVGQALQNGYSAVNNPTMVVAELPWPKKPQTPGRHRYRYNRETGTMEEV